MGEKGKVFSMAREERTAFSIKRVEKGKCFLKTEVYRLDDKEKRHSYPRGNKVDRRNPGDT